MIYRLLKLASFTVLIGRAWQFLRWDTPLRALFWDQGLMEPVVTLLTGWSWQEYATNLDVDQAILTLQHVIGMFFLLAAVASLLVNQQRSWLRYFLYVAGGLLLLMSVLYWKDRSFQVAQLLEYSIQWMTPLFLAAAYRPASRLFATTAALKLAIASTFVGHGLYAFGIFPVPANFINMTMVILHFNEAQALLFLKFAGLLDFIISIGIFLRWRKIVIASLAYAVFWGFVTALARVVANFYVNIPLQSLEQWLHETVFRLPHSLLPFILLILVINSINREQSGATSMPFRLRQPE